MQIKLPPRAANIKFENRIEQYDDPAALHTEVPILDGDVYWRPYLYVRWGSEPYVQVGIETAPRQTLRYTYHGRASVYYLPVLIDVTQLKAGVDENVIRILERMNRNREEYVNEYHCLLGRIIDQRKDVCHTAWLEARLWDLPRRHE